MTNEFVHTNSPFDVEFEGVSYGSYYTVDIDPTLSVEGAAAEAKAVGEALATKQPTGDYAVRSELGDLAAKSIAEKSDLAEDVRNSLDKADSALQSYTETDPTVPGWAKEENKPTYTPDEIGLGNVENKSSETIRNEITSDNITTALGYVPQQKLTGVAGQAVGFDENGEAIAQDANVFYVNLTAKEGTTDRYTADKTKQEVEGAYKAGRAVYCVLDGNLLPLNKMQYTQWAGGVSLDSVAFVGFVGATFCSIDMMDHTNVALEKYGFAVDLGGAPIVFSTHPSQASGKLYYADSNGMLAPLAVDNYSGLRIENGKLTLSSVSRILFYDELANKNYRLNVQNGKLTMTEVNT